MARITGLTKHQIRHRSSDIYKEYLNLARQHRQPPAIAESPTREEEANPQQTSPPRTEAPAPKQRLTPSKTMFSPKKVMSSIRRILRGKGTEGTLATDTECVLQQHPPTSIASFSKSPCLLLPQHKQPNLPTAILGSYLSIGGKSSTTTARSLHL
nr:unnamed protein product [Callosobruchus analis]